MRYAPDSFTQLASNAGALLNLLSSSNSLDSDTAGPRVVLLEDLENKEKEGHAKMVQFEH